MLTSSTANWNKPEVDVGEHGNRQERARDPLKGSLAKEGTHELAELNIHGALPRTTLLPRLLLTLTVEPSECGIVRRRIKHRVFPACKAESVNPHDDRFTPTNLDASVTVTRAQRAGQGRYPRPCPPCARPRALCSWLYPLSPLLRLLAAEATWQSRLLRSLRQSPGPGS